MSYNRKNQFERRNFVCIIDVDSSYCEKNSKNCSVDYSSRSEEMKKCNIVSSYCGKELERCSIVRKPLKLPLKCYRRVTPSCLRKKCNSTRPDRHKKVRHTHHKHRPRNYLRARRRPVNHGHIRRRKQKPNKLLHPISSSSLKVDLEDLYEDISTDSFDATIEKPLSYKNVNNNYCKRRYESKLDTLIRRAKERERKLVEHSRTNQWCSMSSVSFSNVSSEECFYSDFSDVSTLILERNEKNQDSEQSLDKYQNFKTEELNFICHPYSNSSPKEDFFPKLEKYDFQIEDFKSELTERYNVEMSVKSEPMSDIGTYSPIPDYFSSITVKWEPEINPNFTWIDDGIAMTDYDD